MTNCLLFLMDRYNVTFFVIVWENTRIIESGFVIDGLHRFSIILEIQSYPWALFASKNRNIFSSFSLSKMISCNLFSAWYMLHFGRVLMFHGGWQCFLKHSLNKLAFSKKLVKNLSIKRRGRIIVIFSHRQRFSVLTNRLLMT